MDSDSNPSIKGTAIIVSFSARFRSEVQIESNRSAAASVESSELVDMCRMRTRIIVVDCSTGILGYKWVTSSISALAASGKASAANSDKAIAQRIDILEWRGARAIVLWTADGSDSTCQQASRLGDFFMRADTDTIKSHKLPSTSDAAQRRTKLRKVSMAAVLNIAQLSKLAKTVQNSSSK